MFDTLEIENWPVLTFVYGSQIHFWMSDFDIVDEAGADLSGDLLDPDARARSQAERATDDERAHIVALAARFEPSLEIGEFRRLDREFHTTVAAACANPLLIELYGKVLDRLFRSVEFFTLLSAETNQSEVAQIIAQACDAHHQIAAGFLNRDATAVYAAAESHLDGVEQSMVDNLD